jgi:hypothetical protein
MNLAQKVQKTMGSILYLNESGFCRGFLGVFYDCVVIFAGVQLGWFVSCVLGLRNDIGSYGKDT